MPLRGLLAGPKLLSNSWKRLSSPHVYHHNLEVYNNEQGHIHAVDPSVACLAAEGLLHRKEEWSSPTQLGEGWEPPPRGMAFLTFKEDSDCV